MGVLKKFGKWAKKNAGKIGKVALPLAGVGLGLALPGLGGGVPKIISGVGSKLKGAKNALGNLKKEKTGLFGIGDGKPGIFGIGDGKPGIFGIGTGKQAAKRSAEEVERIEAIEAKVQTGQVLTAQEQAIHRLNQREDSPAGGGKTNPLVWLALAAAAALAL